MACGEPVWLHFNAQISSRFKMSKVKLEIRDCVSSYNVLIILYVRSSIMSLSQIEPLLIRPLTDPKQLPLRFCRALKESG